MTIPRPIPSTTPDKKATSAGPKLSQLTSNKTHLQDQVTIATERDINAIIHLQDLWREDVGRLSRAAHGDHLRRGDTFLITHNGQEAGYLMAHGGRDYRTRIVQVAVHEDLLRSTLGTQLMDHVLRHAIRNKQLTIHLQTRVDLPANLFWPTVGYYYAGQARTRNKTRSLLNTWIRTLTAPVFVPERIAKRTCRPTRAHRSSPH